MLCDVRSYGFHKGCVWVFNLHYYSQITIYKGCVWVFNMILDSKTHSKTVLDLKSQSNITLDSKPHSNIILDSKSHSNLVLGLVARIHWSFGDKDESLIMTGQVATCNWLGFSINRPWNST